MDHIFLWPGTKGHSLSRQAQKSSRLALPFDASMSSKSNEYFSDCRKGLITVERPKPFEHSTNLSLCAVLPALPCMHPQYLPERAHPYSRGNPERECEVRRFELQQPGRTQHLLIKPNYITIDLIGSVRISAWKRHFMCPSQD